MDKGGKVLSAGDWEQVMSDFATSEFLQQKWLSAYPAQALLELALNMVVKEKGVEFSLKQQLLAFLEENGALLIGKDVSAGLGRVLGLLKPLLSSPVSSPAVSHMLLSQLTSLLAVLAVQMESQETAPGQLEAIVDLLLTAVSRVNSLSDRQARGAACEALRGLEKATPCLLHSGLGHLLTFCQTERTHVVQSYILLFLEVLEHAAVHVFQKGGVPSEAGNRGGKLATLSAQVTSWVPSYFRSSATSDQGGQNAVKETPQARRSSSSGGALLSAVGPLTPYSLPPFLSSTKPSSGFAKQELTEGTLREFRRAVSFLLESIGLLSEPAIAGVVSSLIRIVTAIGLPASIFKHHFAGLLHTTSPLLIHTALRVYLHFPEAYSDTNERSVLLERLAYLANDSQQPMSARLLSLHWLLALVTCSGKQLESEAMGSQLQPAIFDPIAVKASKAEMLALIGPRSDQASLGSQSSSKQDPKQIPSGSGVFSGAISDSGQAASLEASVAFRTLHRFLKSQSNLLAESEPSVCGSAEASPHWQPGAVLQQISAHLVTIAADHPAQLGNILSLLDRLFQSKPHEKYAEFLLHELESSLLPRLQASSALPAYFPLFQEMVTHGQGDPKPLLNLLANYCTNWGQSKGLEDGVSSEAWLRGTDVLEVCRHVMLVHPRDQILEPLKELLGCLMDNCPDIEVRDSARVYFSFISNLPQERLRVMLSYGEAGEAESAKLLRNTSVFASEAPGPASVDVASYIQIQRVHEPLAAHSLAFDLAFDAAPSENRGNLHTEAGSAREPQGRPNSKQNDSEAKTLLGIEVLLPSSKKRGVLTRYLAEVEGVSKSDRALRIPCFLRYFPQAEEAAISEGLPQLAGIEGQESIDGIDGPDRTEERNEEGEHTEVEKTAVDSMPPAIYSVVLSFSTPGHYGPIPSVHVPFLLADAEQGGASKVGNYPPELVEIEIRPKQPLPTLLETQIEFTDEEAQAITGQLQSIPIGIEDLFCEVPVPAEVEDPASFRGELFDAMWASEQLERAAGTSEKSEGNESEAVRLGGLEGAQTGELGAEQITKPKGAGSEELERTQSRKPKDAQSNETERAQAVKVERAQSQELERAQPEELEWAQSVKLLEVEAEVVVEAVERFLACFVTRVSGERLVEETKQGGVIYDAQVDEPLEGTSSTDESAEHPGKDNRLQLEWSGEERAGERSGRGGLLGGFEVLISLYPKYHLLLKIEVSDWSSLVHIRTDFWPCLAYVDDFLESLVEIT